MHIGIRAGDEPLTLIIDYRYGPVVVFYAIRTVQQLESGIREVNANVCNASSPGSGGNAVLLISNCGPWQIAAINFRCA